MIENKRKSMKVSTIQNELSDNISIKQNITFVEQQAYDELKAMNNKLETELNQLKAVNDGLQSKINDNAMCHKMDQTIIADYQEGEDIYLVE